MMAHNETSHAAVRLLVLHRDRVGLPSFLCLDRPSCCCLFLLLCPCLDFDVALFMICVENYKLCTFCSRSVLYSIYHHDNDTRQKSTRKYYTTQSLTYYLLQDVCSVMMCIRMNGMPTTSTSTCCLSLIFEF